MRSLVRWLLCLAPLALMGCATDPREAKINAVINYLGQAATDISTIKDRVSDSIKNQKDKKLSAEKLTEALSSVESLKNLSKEMQKVKQDIERLAGATTEEQKNTLRAQFQNKLTDAMARIDAERRDLEKTVLEAEAFDGADPKLKELRSKLTEAEGNFVMLARQR